MTDDVTITVADVVQALNVITGGRVPTQAEDLFNGKNRFVVTKSSNLPGKAIVETPGLVCGDLQQPVRKLAVGMTLTESAIELAGGLGVDAILTHHPIADAASSGGVPLRGYLRLYNLAVLELHEAFHGLHPGIAFLHGHKPFKVDIAYGGVPGNIMFVGTVLEGIRTAGDILDRLHDFIDMALEERLLELERKERNCYELMETTVAMPPQLLCGSRHNQVNTILHIFPHTGFSVEHLQQAIQETPEIDTLIASISRVRLDSPLVAKAKELQLTFIAGNSHALEIFENGLPLAYALKALLPRVEVLVFRERMFASPVDKIGGDSIQRYAHQIAEGLLHSTAR